MLKSDNLWCSKSYRGYAYFEELPVPADIVIPLADCDAWPLYPEHNWVYDKLEVAKSQGIACGPHGVPPISFPVFSKPIVNIFGMGAGSRLIDNADDYDSSSQPGHMWMERLAGDHVSTDVAIADGKPVWTQSAVGIPAAQGMFRHWEILPPGSVGTPAIVQDWLGCWLQGYTGMVNVETIGGRIIEVHLRLSDQWVDVYGGPKWGEAVLGLYQHGRWQFEAQRSSSGYSVPLFAPHRSGYRHPPVRLVDEIVADAAISSVQITFWEDYPAGQQPNPPGGFRLAVINAWSLAAGETARMRLARWYEDQGMGPCLVPA